MDAIDLLHLISAYHMTLFTLDFAGAGLSEGEYISLGYYEQDDVLTVLEHLRGVGTVSSVALWGRSMGAATSLLFSAKYNEDPFLKAIILDSSFSSLVQIAREVHSFVMVLNNIMTYILMQRRYNGQSIYLVSMVTLFISSI